MVSLVSSAPALRSAAINSTVWRRRSQTRMSQTQGTHCGRPGAGKSARQGRWTSQSGRRRGDDESLLPAQSLGSLSEDDCQGDGNFPDHCPKTGICRIVSCSGLGDHSCGFCEAGVRGEGQTAADGEGEVCSEGEKGCITTNARCLTSNPARIFLINVQAGR
jgi:hypothetical protein